MLFTQIIAFILVLVVFEAYHPGKPELEAYQSALASLALAVWLWAGCRLATARFLARLGGPRAPLDAAKSGRRLLLGLQVAAVLCVIAMVTLLDLKANLMQIPLLRHSMTLSGLCALLIYAVLLSITWAAGHSIERVVFGQSTSRRDYVAGQLRFVAPVVFPWLSVVVLQDLITWAVPGGRAWLNSYIGDFIFLTAFLVLMAVFFPVLVRTWWGCKPWPPGQVRELTMSVLDLARVRVGGILSWPIMQGRLMTAGILGVAPRFRYLLLTQALVENLTPRELAGVVAHEAGHVHHRHLVYYLLFFMGFFLAAFAISEPLSLVLSYILLSLAGTDFGLSLITGEGSATLSLLMALPLVGFMIVYLRFVMGYFMRHFERQADFFGLRLMDDPEPLAGALEKVASLTGNTRDVPSWHHFSIAQRVRALEKAHLDPGVISRHARRLRKAAAVYLLGLLALGGLGLWAHETQPGLALEREILIQVMNQKVEQEPENASAQLNLGVLLFEKGEEGAARRHLEAAFRLRPDNPEVLNGLAWFLATAEDESLRDEPMAQELASMAVRKKPAAHIWDTLAEAYYVNGHFAKALAASRAALAAKPTQRLGYYQDQLKRFEKAAREQRP